MQLKTALLCGVLWSACAPTTGQLFIVEGPKNQSSIDAGITELELVVAHGSYCGRWVTDETATGQTYSVAKRDLTKSPARLLVVPSHVTNLSDAVRAVVIARNASGAIVGFAPFEGHAFRLDKVDDYNANIELISTGSNSPSYFASGDDGHCVCAPGVPWIGNGSGVGCDARIPPSFNALQNTAGCMLPTGEALPIGVCDGQLYPGEAQNRIVPCYANNSGKCLIGTRTCVDVGGRGVASGCYPPSSAPELPTTALCDALAKCEATACGDGLQCVQVATKPHHTLACSLPVASGAQKGVLVPCPGGSWSLALGAQTGSACSAAMLDGTQVGPLVVGWAATGQTTAQVTSSTCPPTLQVDTVNLADPMDLPASENFSFTLGDAIYDVEVDFTAVCATMGDPSNDLRCVGL